MSVAQEIDVLQNSCKVIQTGYVVFVRVQTSQTATGMPAIWILVTRFCGSKWLKSLWEDNDFLGPNKALFTINEH